MTQLLLEKLGEAEKKRMIQARQVPEDASSSMNPEVISKIVNGKQRVSYTQMLVWSSVIEKHYNKDVVKNYFIDRKLPVPVFTEAMYDTFWALSGHQSPKDVQDAIAYWEQTNPVQQNIKNTDVHINVVHPLEKERKTDALDYTWMPELQ